MLRNEVDISEPESLFASEPVEQPNEILPETNPEHMGLGTDNQAQAHSFVNGVTPDNLVAELPNGDTLTHEAQIDEWSNMISHIKPQSFMMVMMHSAMHRADNQITLTVEESQSPFIERYLA